MTPDEFKTRVTNAKIGEKILYYKGFIAYERENNTSLGELADTVYDYYRNFFVHLVQKKERDNWFSYYAIKRDPLKI